MAALSSTQSGNWTSSSTWGGSTPADGDTFTINRGHKITVNSDVRTTNGFGDIDCYGNLHIATGGKFRLDGRLRVRGNNSVSYSTANTFAEGDADSGGLFSAEGNDIVFEINGTNSEQHSIWVENERHASLEINGDYKRTKTNLSAAVTNGDVYISVDSASGFAAGDWIAVFNDTEESDMNTNNDEGFWVHDVDTTNNRIYIRQYVSPTATITAVSGTAVTVDNAKVFREGYKVICDTGGNRKTALITAINYNTNVITMNVSFAAANVGETLYQTGAERFHIIDDAVEKIATTLTTAITSTGGNQITVGSANDISVGDTIVIDVNNDELTNWNYDSKYVVSGKSGNTLTLSSNISHKHNAGSIVQILNRHIVFKGVDSNVRPFLYVEYWTSTNETATRHICLKNCEFDTWGGNSNSTYYRGVMIAGYNSWHDAGSTSGNRDYASRVQGVTLHDSTGSNDYNGLSFRHSYGLKIRNNFVYGSGSMNRLMWWWSTQYNPAINNNYVTRSAYTGFHMDSMYDYFCDFSYNYATRTDDYAIMLHQNRQGHTISHNIMLNNENRPLYMFYQGHNSTMRRLYAKGFRYFPYKGAADGTTNFIDCYFDPKWYKRYWNENTDDAVLSTSFYGYGGMPGEANFYGNTGGNGLIKMYEDRFEFDQFAHLGYDSLCVKQKDGTWKGFCLDDSNGLFWSDGIYVPANTTVRLSCKVKGQNNSNYSFPALYAVDNQNTYETGRYRENKNQSTRLQSNDSKITRSNGFWAQDTASSAMRGAWETLQLAVDPQEFGYFLAYGIMVNNSNLREDPVYFTEPEVLFDKARPMKSHTDGRNATRSGYTRAKKRIGGTRL